MLLIDLYRRSILCLCTHSAGSFTSSATAFNSFTTSILRGRLVKISNGLPFHVRHVNRDDGGVHKRRYPNRPDHTSFNPPKAFVCFSFGAIGLEFLLPYFRRTISKEKEMLSDIRLLAMPNTKLFSRTGNFLWWMILSLLEFGVFQGWEKIFEVFLELFC